MNRETSIFIKNYFFSSGMFFFLFFWFLYFPYEVFTETVFARWNIICWFLLGIIKYTLASVFSSIQTRGAANITYEYELLWDKDKQTT